MPQLDPLIDGFSYSLSQRLTPNSYDALTLGELDTLRRANGYRPKLYAVPDWTDPVISEFQVIQQQIHVPPGSYLWCISNSKLTSQPNYFIYVRDETTGLDLFNSAFANDTTFRTYADGPFFSCMLNPKLACPVLVSGTGLVTVRISNSNATAQLFQFVLMFATPCNSAAIQTYPCSPDI